MQTKPKKDPNRKRKPPQRCVSVPMARIITDSRLQMRVKGLDAEHIADLAEAQNKGAKLVVDVVAVAGEEDDGLPKMYVWDGHHQLAAYEKNGIQTVICRVKHGSWEDALLLAAGANSEHLALKRTHRDKERAVAAVEIIMPGASARKVASYVGVSNTFVSNIRKRKTGVNVDTPDDEDEEIEERPTHTPSGKLIGRPPAAAKALPEPQEERKTVEAVGPDWKAFEAAFGVVARFVDTLAGVENGKPTQYHGEWSAARRNLKAFIDVAEDWKKRLEPRKG